MAATKKNQEIRDQKEVMRVEYDKLAEQLRSSSKSIPKSVVCGGARLAEQWKKRAGQAMNAKSMPKHSRMSLPEIMSKMADMNAEISYLQNPCVE